MSYKKIIATENGDGTIFELECGIFALCKHTRSQERAWYASRVEVFMRAYTEFIPASQMPEGMCDADIAVLENIERLESKYGISHEKQRELENLKRHLEYNPDFLKTRGDGFK